MHKETSNIVGSNSLVAGEQLNVKGMTAKANKGGVTEWCHDFAGFLTESQAFQKLFHSQIQQRPGSMRQLGAKKCQKQTAAAVGETPRSACGGE